MVFPFIYIPDIILNLIPSLKPKCHATKLSCSQAEMCSTTYLHLKTESVLKSPGMKVPDKPI